MGNSYLQHLFVEINVVPLHFSVMYVYIVFRKGQKIETGILASQKVEKCQKKSEQLDQVEQ